MAASWPSSSTSTTPPAYRAQIEDDGYTIIQNVGNNWTDLNGGHAERTYKLPTTTAPSRRCVIGARTSR
ncbi:HAD family acid phosphatase [Nocardia sp. NPDC051052]|uniref:HAD family acid phosphatase n=1 Tax=Nocardia sp. NPDC051052 TaxID=3364322 RepID=UPI0037AA49A6